MTADERDYTVTDTDCVIRVVATKPHMSKKPDGTHRNKQFKFRMAVNNHEGKTYHSSHGSWAQTFKGQVAERDRRTAAQKTEMKCLLMRYTSMNRRNFLLGGHSAQKRSYKNQDKENSKVKAAAMLSAQWLTSAFVARLHARFAGLRILFPK